MNNVTGYINYFRGLAVGHYLIKHDPASEDGDCEPGAQRFTKIAVEEVLSALRSKMGFPALLVELYETQTESEMAYDVNLRTHGAFQIIDHPADDSFKAQMQCYEITEAIVYDILKQIWQDHYGAGKDRCQTPFRFFDFNKVEIVPTGKLYDNEYGYRVEFFFEFQKRNDLAQPPAPGTFQYPTTIQDGDNENLVQPNGSSLSTFTDNPEA